MGATRYRVAPICVHGSAVEAGIGGSQAQLMVEYSTSDVCAAPTLCTASVGAIKALARGLPLTLTTGELTLAVRGNIVMMFLLGSLLSTTACSVNPTQDVATSTEPTSRANMNTTISPSGTHQPQPEPLAATVTGTAGADPQTSALPTQVAPENLAETVTAGDQGDTSYGFTHQRADGNRLVAGRGNFPAAQVVDVPIGGSPSWIVAVPSSQGVIWVAVLVDGTAHAFRTVGNEVEPIPVVPDRLPPGMPPLVRVTGDAVSLVEADGQASTLTHPLPDDDTMLWVTPQGDVETNANGGSKVTTVQALPDARLVRDETGLVALLGGATEERYQHDVLGDSIEASQIVLLATEPTLRIAPNH